MTIALAYMTATGLSWESIFPSSAIGIAGILVIIIIALLSDRLVTGPQHKRELLSQAAAKDAIITLITADRDHYKAAHDVQKLRADALSDKMTDNVVPLVQGVNKLLEAFAEAGSERE